MLEGVVTIIEVELTLSRVPGHICICPCAFLTALPSVYIMLLASWNSGA